MGRKLVTEAEALAACLGRGRSRALCEELLESSRVGGVYCDGTIVIDASGKRCVSRELAARVEAARNAAPLPVAVVIDPSTSLEPSGGSRWIVLGFGAALVAAVVWAVRR